MWLECAPALLELVKPIAGRFGVITAEGLRTFRGELTGKYDLRRELYLSARDLRNAPIKKFLSFVETCPGVHVMSVLLELGQIDGNHWRNGPSVRHDREYPSLCMLDFPHIPGADPIALLRVIQRIAEGVLHVPKAVLRPWVRKIRHVVILLLFRSKTGIAAHHTICGVCSSD
jgi:hypothetical protein